MGSLGVGCTLDKGVTVRVKQSAKLEVVFNDAPILFPTVISVVKTLTTTPITVTISSPLPLGFGFGISGASALATAFVLNDNLKLSKNPSRLIEIAHIAEVENKTGLGSVATQSTGGFLLKIKPGIPTKVKRLPFVGQKLYATIIGLIETPKVLQENSIITRVNKTAKSALEKIQESKQLSLASILDISLAFSQNSGLLQNKNVMELIDMIRRAGGHATMAMLGQVVISDIRPPYTKYRIEKLTITDNMLF